VAGQVQRKCVKICNGFSLVTCKVKQSGLSSNQKLLDVPAEKHFERLQLDGNYLNLLLRLLILVANK